MAKALRSLHFLILIILSIQNISLAQNNGSNDFIFRGFKEGSLQIDGNARFRPDRLLQLTNTSQREIGHAFYPRPFQFKSSSPPSNSSSNSSPKYLSFSTNFVLAIVPVLQGGHGMAFVISPSKNFTGATTASYLGLFNRFNNGLSSNNILAVEFDTVQSDEHGDINDNHVGIDVNGLNSTISAPVSYYLEGKNQSLSLNSSSPIQVWIDYDEDEKLLNVTVAPTDIPKPIRPLISTKINLSSILLDYMYVGFSAATGAVASDHYVLGWSFNKSGQSQNLRISDLPSLPPPPPTIKKGQKLDKSVKISIGAVVFSGIIVALAIYYVRRKKYEEVREDWEKQYGPQRFSYKDLYRATKGFRDKELLGAGGSGKVYRGVIPSSKQHIAVKRISHNSKQGLNEFIAEIATMGSLKHKNLVNLLGYCRRRGELLLVYDCMPNGSLDMFLFSDDRKPNLAWFQRFQIIKDVAAALLYLHEEWEQVVLHRDVKASNVMLDSEMNGRLGDFGLAILHDHGTNPETTTLVVGTIGYLAPEVPTTGKFTTSSDVFAFGAFMLEMVCGRKPIEFQRSKEELVLVDWVLENFRNGKILETVDPRVENDFSVHETELVLKLGLLCSDFRAENRPHMKQIMFYLNGANLPEIGHEYGIRGHGSRLAEITQVITDDAGLSYGGSTTSFDLYPITRPLSTNVPEIETADEHGGIGTEATKDDAGISYGGSTVNRNSDLPITSSDLYPVTR